MRRSLGQFEYKLAQVQEGSSDVPVGTEGNGRRRSTQGMIQWGKHTPCCGQDCGHMPHLAHDGLELLKGSAVLFEESGCCLSNASCFSLGKVHRPGCAITDKPKQLLLMRPLSVARLQFFSRRSGLFRRCGRT